MSHTCPEGYTIPSSLVCDGTRHCTDGSDENTCDHICPEGYSIPVELKCDNVPHCSDSSDEIGCPTSEESTENIVSTTTTTSTTATTTTTTTVPACPTSDPHYYLVSGKCHYFEFKNMNRSDAR